MADKEKKMSPSKDVLLRYTHGAALATHRANAGKRSSGNKKKGKAKVKLLRPPEGGWKN